MKNIAVLTGLVIILSVYSYAQESEKNYRILFGPQFGFIYGQAQEYVYPLQGEVKNDLLSELLWDMKPVFYFGMQGEYSRTDIMKSPGFFSSFSLKTGFPADSGVMEDRDWQSKENRNVTSFSSHTNKTNFFLQMEASFGASFPIKSLLYIKPFISGSWTRFSFTGRNGYGKYARKESFYTYYPIDEDPLLVSFNGKEVIRYMQDWLLLAAGLSAGTKIFYPFSFDISFQISPLTYCIASDTHIARNIVFRDYTLWGLFLEPSFKMSLDVKTVEFSLGAGYRHIGKTKGNSYTNYNDLGYMPEENKAGAGLSMWDSSFLVSFRL